MFYFAQGCLLCWLLHKFICFHGKARTHPDTDPASIAFFWMRENSYLKPLCIEPVLWYLDTFVRAELDAVSTSFAVFFVNQDFAFCHCMISLPRCLLQSIPL